MNGEVRPSQEMHTPADLGLAGKRGPYFSVGGIDWVTLGLSVSGPLVTLALVVGLDALTRSGVRVPYPFPILLLSVVWAAWRGGVRPALISAVLTALYAVHFLAQPGTLLHYDRAGALAVAMVAAAGITIAGLVGRLREDATGIERTALTRGESERLERRLAFFADASATLASSLDYELTLRSLARLTVPTLGDWCLICVAGPDGALRRVAGAHWDPSKDLVVRALCGYGAGRTGPGLGGTSRGAVFQATDDVLDRLGGDEESVRLLRMLGPRWIVTAPMRAGGATSGMIVLAASESARTYHDDDVAVAEQLASRATLAVENARLYHAAEEAERRYRVLFEASPQPMWVFDVESLVFVSVNDAAVRHYGYSREEFLAMNIMDIRPADEFAGLVEPADRPATARDEVAITRHQKKDGTIIDVEIVSHELELDSGRARLVQVTDVTERTRTQAALRQREEQLRQVQRMDAVARLAGGVAHDFNNLLTTIQGFSEIVLREYDPADPRRKDLEVIRDAAQRGAILTRQLMSFGRRQGIQPRPTDLNALVISMEPLVQRLIGADLRVVIRLAPELGRVLFDPGQLEQVMVNLVLNARDAMGPGGTLAIETAERYVGAGPRARHLRPGRYAVLSIADTGAVVETVPETGEPGGSRGSAGRGALGLSIAYGIVRQGGGIIRVASEPGHGTKVKVYIPLLPEGETESPAAAPAALGGNETVLVCDDEEGVRALLRKCLVQRGYSVVEARHGRDALLAAERHGRPVDLLVTDVVMPEMGGPELAAQLTARNPRLKVLYISGYTNDEVTRRGLSESNAAFVQKPFRPDELVRRIRELLDTGDRAGEVSS